MKGLAETKKIALLNAFAQTTQDGIQISDIQGNIIFMNECSRKRLGVPLDQPIHVRDFEPLFQEVSAWEKHISDLRMQENVVIRSTNINLVSGELIPVEVVVHLKEIDDEEYVFAVTKDISSLVEKDKKLLTRETMLIAISEATSELLDNKNFFSATSKVLEIVGTAVRVDRTYLFTCNEDELGQKVVSQRCEWNSGDAEPQIDNPDLQNTPTALFEDFMDLMYQNIPFQSIVAELPDNSVLREILASQGIISVLIIPIFHKGEFWGFIGYDECEFERIWDLVEISILQTLSNNIAAALERLDYNTQIEDLAEFPIENPAPVMRIDNSGAVLFHNKIEQIQNKQFSRAGRNESISFSELVQLITDDVLSGEKIKYYEVKAGKSDFYAITAKVVENKKHINLYFSDISKLKHTEKQLRETRSIVDQIVNNIEDVIWSVSYPDFNSLFISPSTEKLFGISANEFYKNSKLLLKAIYKEDKYVIQEMINNLQEKGESNVEFRILLPNGEQKWVKNRMKLMYDPVTNAPVRLDGYIIDVTDQKRTQELSEKARQLAEESNLAKEEFISNMSHEIRTPLNAILGLSRQLLDRAEDAEMRTTINNVVQSGNHLQSLIENVLDFSKITAGQFELNPVRTNLLNEISSVFFMLEGHAKEKGITYKQVIDDHLNVFVELDKRGFKQILINILSNAIKFTDEGLVLLHAKLLSNQQTIEFIIKDTGIGMSEEFVNRIFDKFAQEDGSHERRSQGSGLGMAITKMLIDLMGGQIFVKSTKGLGTEIRVNLPYFKLVKESPDYERNKLKSFDDLKEKHVLIVEDNELNAIVVQNVLSKYGIETTCCKNGMEAIETLKRNQFDMILMDTQMPVMGGITATQIIRNELILNTPIIGLSANALQSSKNECLAAGMNDYVTKPFEEELLLEVMSTYLTNKSRSDKGYNLSRYFSGEQSNADYLHEIVMMFIESMPRYVDEMKEAFENKDYDVIRRVAHKVKPNLLMFGIVCCKEEVNFLNRLNEKNKDDLLKLKDAIDSLDNSIKVVCEELRKDCLSERLFS